MVGTYDGEALRMFINGVPVPDDSGFVAVSVGVIMCVCVCVCVEDYFGCVCLCVCES